MTKRFNDESRRPVERRPAGFYTRQEVETLTTLSRTAIYDRIRVGTFPRSVRLGVNCVAWRCEQVNAWLDDPMGWRANTETQTQPV